MAAKKLEDFFHSLEKDIFLTYFFASIDFSNFFLYNDEYLLVILSLSKKILKKSGKIATFIAIHGLISELQK